MYRLTNEQVRRLLMSRQGLATNPWRKMKPSDWQSLIEAMGFVQVDSVRTLARAHDAVLFSRNQTYHPDILKSLLERDRQLFENWTHDASIIPAAFFPYWRLRFARERQRLAGRWRKWGRGGFEMVLEQIIERVRVLGPTRARDLIDQPRGKKSGWWDWHPGKTALEYHWRTGALAISGRDGFQKIYDLTERVIPQSQLEPRLDEQTMIDWCCRASLERLGAATAGEIAAFFDHVSPAEASRWASRQNDLIEVGAVCADGAVRKMLAFASIEQDRGLVADIPGRLRLLSPFDPVLRDRVRVSRLFGFDYRIEIFVPAARRRYGYYVFPIVEGLALIGRIDVWTDKACDALVVKGLWLEPRVRLGRVRLGALEAELDRYRRFCGVGDVIFEVGWRSDVL